MAMDSIVFKNLLETVQNNTAPAMLDLTDKLDKAQAIELSSSLKTNTSVRSLVLRCNKLGPTAATALGNLLRVNRTLQHLNLEDNQIGAEGTKALAPALTNSRLLSLDLGWNQIGDKGAKALVPALTNSRLQSLDLVYNQIGDEGTKALAPALKDSRLQSLGLGRNQIGTEGAKALALTLKDSRLLRLGLGRNQIGTEGAKALASALKDTRLQSSDLGGNQIGTEGAKALASALKDTRLQSLDLEGNQIGTEGAKALALTLKDSRLLSLGLFYSQINVEGAKALALAIKGSRLQRLYFEWGEIDTQALADIEAMLEPKNLHAHKIIADIQQQLQTLEAQFQSLLTLSSDEASRVNPSYAKQCKGLYIQAKRLLQTWEMLDLKASTFNANQHWQLLLWQCIDKIPSNQQDEIADLAFSWIEDDTVNSDTDHKEDKESAEMKKTAETEQSPSPAPADIQKTFHVNLVSDPKEDKESAEMKKTVEIEQTPSPAILADIQKTFHTQEQQLRQNLQRQEQTLIDKINNLEIQIKQNNTKDLEQQLAQLRAQYIELLERQIDPCLLMNQVEMLNKKTQTQTQEDLEVLRAQLQQRLMLLETETAEEHQKRVTETSAYAEQLTQQFQAQEHALNIRIEDVQRKLEAGDIKQQQQLDQLQQEHNQLMESHKIKQQILAKRQYFESITPLRLFYRSVQVKLQELFLACKVLDSGKVPRTKCTTKDKIAEGIQIAGDWIPLPYASEVASVFSKLLQKQSDKEEKIHAETVAYLAIGFSEIDALSEETSRLLTERYEEQLQCLKPEGAKCLGECAVKYMIAYMTGQQLKPEQSLVQQYLYSVLTLDVHNGWWPKTHKEIATLPPKSGWTDNGIFKHPGIKTPENEFFSDLQKKNVNKYGYRLGTKAEALTAGFTQTKERLDATVDAQQPSPLTPAGHKQVATVTVITQNHSEQLERIQRQLQQEHDMRALETKKNAELQARLDAQEKEIEILKAFMAQFTPPQSSPQHSHTRQSLQK